MNDENEINVKYYVGIISRTCDYAFVVGAFIGLISLKNYISEIETTSGKVLEIILAIVGYGIGAIVIEGFFLVLCCLADIKINTSKKRNIFSILAIIIILLFSFWMYL